MEDGRTTQLELNYTKLHLYYLLCIGRRILHSQSQRGIRQGDPLFFIVFDMVVDVLNRLIKREVMSKRLGTYIVKSASSLVTKLDGID